LFGIQVEGISKREIEKPRACKKNLMEFLGKKILLRKLADSFSRLKE